MIQFNLIHFTSGLLLSFLLGASVRVIHGLRMYLYFAEDDLIPENRTIIPVTSERKKKSLWIRLVSRRWQEDVVMTLADFSGNIVTFQIQYHFWGGYYLVVEEKTAHLKLGDIPVQNDKVYYLKNNGKLKIGDRQFTIKITPKLPHQLLSSQGED